MSELKLSVTKREGVGRGHARRLRAQGRVPAVIYGKSGNENLSVSERDFKMLMREVSGGAAIISLEQESGDSTLSIVQDAQRNPLTDRFEHIDFLEVTRGVKMSATVPVHTHGQPVGVKTGNGTLDTVVYELVIECLPSNLPESITIDVSHLDVGDAVHIKDIPPMEGVEFQGDPETVIAIVAEEAEEVDEATEEVSADEVEATAQKGDKDDDESDEKKDS